MKEEMNLDVLYPFADRMAAAAVTGAAALAVPEHVRLTSTPSGDHPRWPSIFLLGDTPPLIPGLAQARARQLDRAWDPANKAL